MNRYRRLLDYGILGLVALFLFRNAIFNQGFPVGPDSIAWIGYPGYLAENSWGYLAWEGQGFPGTISQIVPMNAVLTLLFEVFRSPLGVKLLLFATYLTAGVATYHLAWHWFRSRNTALVAGLVYMAGRPFLDYLFEGHLWTVWGAALLPLLILSWDYMVRQRRLKHVILAAVAFSLYLGNAHLSFVYFSFFFLAPFLLWDTVKARLEAKGVGWGQFLKPLVLFPPALVALSLIFVLPMVATQNVSEQVTSRPIFMLLSSMQRYSSQDLLKAVTLTGIEAEPVFPVVASNLLLLLLPILALPALFFRKEGRVFLLTVLGLFFVFLAKGPNPPLGGIFSWMVGHIPYFAGLRAPPRGLLVTGFCYAILAGITVDGMCAWIKSSSPDWLKRTKAMGRMPLYEIGSSALVALLMGAFLVPQWPMLKMSVKSFYVSDDIRGLYDWVERQPGDFVVANLPFQSGTGYIDPIDPAAEPRWSSTSEFGMWSSAFHGKTVLAYSQWYPYARFYLSGNRYNVLQSGSLGRLLGASNIRYVAALPYASQAEKDLFASQEGLTKVFENKTTAVYENSYWVPRLFASPGYVALVGGSQALLSSSSLLTSAESRPVPLMSLFHNPTTPDDLLGRADAVLFADGDFLDLLFASLQSRGEHVVDATAYAPVSSTNPTGWVPDDLLAAQGLSLASSGWGYAHSGQDGARLDVPFEVDSAGTYEIWLRALHSQARGKLELSLDGQKANDLFLESNIPYAGFRWVKGAQAKLGPGQYVLGLTNWKLPSGGIENDIDMVAVVQTSTAETERQRLAQLLSNKTLVAFFQEDRLSASQRVKGDREASDGRVLALGAAPGPTSLDVEVPADRPYYIGFRVRRGGPASSGQVVVRANSALIGVLNLQGEQTLVGPDVVADDGQAASWTPLNPSTQVTIGDDPAIRRIGSDSLRISINAPGRAFFSLLDRDFPKFQDWSHKKFLTLWFKGTGSGAPLELGIYSNGEDSQRTNVSFIDGSTEWQEIVLPLPAPDASPVDWSHISKLRLGMNTKDATGTLYIDRAPLWAHMETEQTEAEGFAWVHLDQALPLKAGTSRIALEPKGDVELDMVSLSTLPGSLEDTFLYRPQESAAISYKKIDPTRYEVRVKADKPFFLGFSETYHQGWRAYVDKEEIAPIPMNYYFNGFAIDKPGEYDISIVFVPQKYVTFAVKASGVVWLLAGGCLVFLALVSRRRRANG